MPPPNPTATTLKRIHREIADLKKEDLGPIQLAPTDDDLFHWTATIPGPDGSVYEGGIFHVEIILGHDYPFSAPRMVFRTRIYHMNINERGSICIDILKHNWSPALSLFKVILSLSSLLTDPNPIPSIATEYVRNRVQHDREARRWTELYARPKASDDKDKGKGKGKGRAAPAPAQRTSARPAGAGASVLVISDDEEGAAPRRTRAAAAVAATATAGTKRKRAAVADGEVDIDLSNDDGGGGPARATRRARTGAPGEVIVIEDED
ncbi:ubiquitin-conjugating enzyme/RWD-like protein [Epithele typhae]|uniref:ubiquitin-conjugating enzyme/RWD-like protein n=1 Tax=Epithele typhae TaxID=378194 RepID=UPI002008A34C|nr:ubiquitin-conjugating enzyme/RWD-like protein [Epithele typhae]KAH9914184.1 ubiquitin-conjugating enzyme/RWD-like protein [Epithele typhae]